MNIVQIKLQLIENFSLVAKALASSARPTPPTGSMLQASERCADTIAHIAHIAQFDREDLQHAFQVEHLTTMGGFLNQTLKAFSAELSTSPCHVPSQADMANLIRFIEQA